MTQSSQCRLSNAVAMGYSTKSAIHHIQFVEVSLPFSVLMLLNYCSTGTGFYGCPGSGNTPHLVRSLRFSGHRDPCSLCYCQPLFQLVVKMSKFSYYYSLEKKWPLIAQFACLITHQHFSGTQRGR